MTSAKRSILAEKFSVTARYAKAGKKVHLRHLSEDCRALIDKAESIIEINHFQDPTYKVVRDVR